MGKVKKWNFGAPEVNNSNQNDVIHRVLLEDGTPRALLGTVRCL